MTDTSRGRAAAALGAAAGRGRPARPRGRRGRQGRQPRRAGPRRRPGAARFRAQTDAHAAAGRDGPIPADIEQAVLTAYADLGGWPGRRPLQRHGRGPAGGGLRRTAGHVPRRRGRAGPAGRGAEMLGVAVVRAGDGLPAARGIDDAAVRMAVVVQRMVPAEVAGVAFTANPVTGARDRDRDRRRPRARRGGGVGDGHRRPPGRRPPPRPAAAAVGPGARPARRQRGDRPGGHRRADREALRAAAGHRVGVRRPDPVDRAGPADDRAAPAAAAPEPVGSDAVRHDGRAASGPAVPVGHDDLGDPGPWPDPGPDGP